MCWNGCGLDKIAVVVSFVLSLVMNGLGSSGALSGKSIGEISNEYPTYVTPDGLTFSIWAVIYTLELVLVVRQVSPDPHAEALLSQPGPSGCFSVRWRLVMVFMANGIWLPLYVNLCFGWALIVIIVYLGYLLSVYRDLNSKTASSFWEWLSFCAGIACNASWVLVATCANAFTFAGVLGWKDSFGVAGTPTAAAVVVVAVSVIGIFKAVLRSDLAWSLVVCWALAGVYRMQTGSDPDAFPEGALDRQLAIVAIWCSSVTFLASLVGLFLGDNNGALQGLKGVTVAKPLATGALSP